MAELSEMSGMDQTTMPDTSSMSEMSTTGSEVQPQGTDGSTRLIIVGVIVVIIILLLLGGGIYVMATAVLGSQSGGGEELSDTKQPEGYVVARKDNKGDRDVTTTKVTATTTEETGPSSETPDNYVEPPTTPRPVPKKRKSYSDVFMCTITESALSPLQYPPDGICDILFYTNAYYDGSKKDFRGAYDLASFGLFRKKARSSTASSRTAYGVSFDYQYAPITSTALSNKAAQDKFQAMWKDKIYHYGILHAWADPSVLKTSNKNLDLIKELKKRTDAIKGETMVELAIGFQLLSGEHLKQVKDVADYIQKNYPITILVAITHLFRKKRVDKYNYSNGPSTWNGCYLKYNKKADCPHLMKDIATQLKTLSPRENVAVVVSFTMTAAYWKLDRKAYVGTKMDLNFKYDGFWRSLGYNQVEHVQKCWENYTEPQRYDKHGDFYYTGSTKTFFVLAFDTYESLQRKMEKYVDLMGSRPGRQGWAVYDVDFDDYNNACNYNTKFKNLRAVSRFFHL